MNWKVAVVGCGNWGENLLRNFCRLLGPERVACCDQKPEIIRNLKHRYPGVGVAEDVQHVLSDPSIIAVAIATPTLTHYAIARDSLLMGKHAFVEKPLATSLIEAEELRTLAERNSKMLMTDHVLLFHPAIRELTACVRAGQLGDIYYVYSRRTNLGIIRSEENVLWSLGPHDVAVTLSIMRDTPAKVVAQGGVYLQPRLGVHDVVFLTLVFPNGKLANIHLSWFDPKKTRDITVLGSRKMGVFDDMEPVAKLRIYDKGADFTSFDGLPSTRDGKAYEVPFSTDEPLMLACQHFLECIESGRVEMSNEMSGLEVVRVLEHAQRSLDAGGIPIELSRVAP